jgi:hypothetical protein
MDDALPDSTVESLSKGLRRNPIECYAEPANARSVQVRGSLLKSIVTGWHRAHYFALRDPGLSNLHSRAKRPNDSLACADSSARADDARLSICHISATISLHSLVRLHRIDRSARGIVTARHERRQFLEALC